MVEGHPDLAVVGGLKEQSEKLPSDSSFKTIIEFLKNTLEAFIVPDTLGTLAGCT